MTADFEGDLLFSDDGLVVLREAERRFGLAGTLAGCMRDRRDPAAAVHTLQAVRRPECSRSPAAIRTPTTARSCGTIAYSCMDAPPGGTDDWIVDDDMDMPERHSLLYAIHTWLAVHRPMANE